MTEDYFMGMTTKDIAEYKEAEQQIEQDAKKQFERDNIVLAIIKKQVPKEFYDRLDNEIKETENYSNFRIVTEPVGDPQPHAEYSGIKIWVDQCSVGDSGDSWEGTVCAKLPSGKYLLWDFWM